MFKNCRLPKAALNYLRRLIIPSFESGLEIALLGLLLYRGEQNLTKSNLRKGQLFMVEYRHRDLWMPAFHRRCGDPNIAYAQFDKINLLIKRAYHIHLEDMDAYNRFKLSLGGADAEVFSRKGGQYSSVFALRRAGNLGERWLFHGSRLSFKRAPSSSSDFIGTLSLMLNPTRYLNHRIQQIGVRSAYENLGIFSNIQYLARMTPLDAVERWPYLSDNAFGLDGNDNVIPKLLYRHLCSAPVTTMLYLDKILNFLNDEIRRALEVSQREDSYVFEDPMQEWSLPKTEIYWEYSVSDAVSFVNGLRTFLVPQFSDAEIAEYILPGEQVVRVDRPLPARRWAINGNAPSLKLNLGSKDVDLVVYAKNIERVRFEVRYNSNLKSLVGARRSAVLSQSVDGANVLLQFAIENAQRRLGRVLAAMPDLDFSERCDFQIFVDFLSDLAEACRDGTGRGGLRSIMGLLASNGSIEVSPASTEQAICQELENNHILFLQRAARNPRSGKRRYCLNPRYANSLAIMLGAFPVSQ